MPKQSVSDHSLSLGLPLTMMLSWLFPELGMGLASQFSSFYCIIAIFFITGLNFNPGNCPLDRKLFWACFWVVLTSMICCPILVYHTLDWTDHAEQLKVGWVVICSMPTTLSSGLVIACSAGGSMLWCLGFIVLTNTCAILTLPLLLPQLLGEGVSILPFELLTKLLEAVILPFGLGWCLTKIPHCRNIGTTLKKWPTYFVLLVVMMSMSSSKDQLDGLSLDSIWTICLISLSIHLLLMFVMFIFVKITALANDSALSLLICGSQKTLPVALSVLSFIGEDSGLAVLACLSFHLCQLSFDALFVNSLKRLITSL